MSSSAQRVPENMFLKEKREGDEGNKRFVQNQLSESSRKIDL